LESGERLLDTGINEEVDIADQEADVAEWEEIN
jgi:hypothetical protein